MYYDYFSGDIELEMRLDRLECAISNHPFSNTRELLHLISNIDDSFSSYLPQQDFFIQERGITPSGEPSYTCNCIHHFFFIFRAWFLQQ